METIVLLMHLPNESPSRGVIRISNHICIPCDARTNLRSSTTWGTHEHGTSLAFQKRAQCTFPNYSWTRSTIMPTISAGESKIIGSRTEPDLLADPYVGKWIVTSTAGAGATVGTDTLPNGWSLISRNGCACVNGGIPRSASALVSAPSNAPPGPYFFQYVACEKPDNLNPGQMMWCVVYANFDVGPANSDVSRIPNPCGEM